MEGGLWEWMDEGRNERSVRGMDGLRLKWKEGYGNGWIKVEMEGGLWEWMD